MVSFLIVAAIIGALVAGFLAVRRTRHVEPAAPIEEGEVVSTGLLAEIQLAQQALTQAGIWSTTRDVSRTAYALPQEFELWVKAKDAGRAREVLGLDDEE